MLETIVIGLGLLFACIVVLSLTDLVLDVLLTRYDVSDGVANKVRGIVFYGYAAVFFLGVGVYYF